MKSNKKTLVMQSGFSLIELLVGLIIGLLATLAIMQVFSVFEGQKRTTSGNADAQVNGSIALFTMQRDLQSAGFGLASFSKFNNILSCDPTVTVDHDGNGATPQIDIFPISITDGGASSDSIAVRYAEDGAQAKGGILMQIVSVLGTEIEVKNNLGCNDQDVAFISDGSSCALTRVSDSNLSAVTDKITVLNSAVAAVDGAIACIGRWNQFTYRIVNNQLQRNNARTTTATPIVNDIVDMQVQYGISSAITNDQVTSWVDATGAWANPSVPNRNLIRAIHVAVVARNGLAEKTDVTQPCTTTKGTVNNGPCAWDDTDLPSAAPAINLSADANWKRYRYRAYDTIIPLRNMIWSRAE